MESFFERYRNLLVLLAILVAQIIGLAMQVRSTASGRNSLDPRDGSGVRLIRLWADLLVSPPERVIHSSKMGVGGIWDDYVDLRHVREQNQDLQKTVDRLRLEQASLLEDAREGQRLQTLLGFQQKYIYTTVVAEAVGTSGSDQSRVFYINKGSSDGLQRDNAVITADGIVGKVRDVFPHSAQVLGINDQTSGAGVILETTRIRGILRGNAAGKPQIVDILADQRIQPGEKVFTAGGDQIFPRGLPVGVVEQVVRDPDRDSFIDVIVKPAANLERLDEVLVITSTEPHFSAQDQQDLATSEQLKGAEAAAIKEQQKASEIKAERLPGLADPNLPPDQQPMSDTSNPNGVVRPPQAIHPDRFSPEGSGTTEPAQKGGAGADAAPKTPRAGPAAASGIVGKPATTKPAGKPATTGPATPKPAAKPGTAGEAKPPATTPERNP